MRLQPAQHSLTLRDDIVATDERRPSLRRAAQTGDAEGSDASTDGIAGAAMALSTDGGDKASCEATGAAL
eukprot:gene25266-37009_t